MAQQTLKPSTYISPKPLLHRCLRDGGCCLLLSVRMVMRSAVSLVMSSCIACGTYNSFGTDRASETTPIVPFSIRTLCWCGLWWVSCAEDLLDNIGITLDREVNVVLSSCLFQCANSCLQVCSWNAARDTTGV
jgi:hypothetical protein